jgi:hypothetical protein
MVSLDDAAIAAVDTRLDLVALDDALRRLAEVAPRPAHVVELRYFGGMSGTIFELGSCKMPH